MTIKYIAESYQRMLRDHHLADFSSIWDAKVAWFEEPNERRGGWSGVGKMMLSDGSVQQGVFLKRQQNHQRRTLRHPLYGQPTFACEFEMINYLAKHGVPSLEVVAFGTRDSDAGEQAILMTKELAGFESLESFTEKLFETRPLVSKQNLVIGQVAKTVAKLHQSGVQHRSLYPKHLFVDKELSREVVVIDLEKSRVKYMGFLRAFYDLATLNRHARHWTKTRRLYFYLQYLGQPKLTFISKCLCRLIIKRSQR